jgi:hypothetical protein
VLQATDIPCSKAEERIPRSGGVQTAEEGAAGP